MSFLVEIASSSSHVARRVRVDTVRERFDVWGLWFQSRSTSVMCCRTATIIAMMRFRAGLGAIRNRAGAVCDLWHLLQLEIVVWCIKSSSPNHQASHHHFLVYELQTPSQWWHVFVFPKNPNTYNACAVLPFLSDEKSGSAVCNGLVQLAASTWA